MTNDEYIRKAVELAEGWHFKFTEYGEAFGSGDSMAGIWSLLEVAHPYQPVLDALAAQLVRQVDSVGGLVWFRDRREVFVFKHDEQARNVDDDRTMSTIKAIVDSGVLQ